jgi:hypothetical protein
MAKSPVPQIAVIETASQNKTVNYVIAGAAILAAIGIILVGKKIFETLGITKTKDEKELAGGIEDLEKSGYLSGAYWRTLGEEYANKNLKSKREALLKIAKDYEKAQRGLYEDEDAMIASIKQLLTLAEFSYIADYIQTEYQKDLWGTLKSGLNDEEILQVKRYLKSLPKK